MTTITTPTAAAATGTAAAAGEPNATLRSWWGLIVMVLIGLYVVMDRQVLVLQVEPIRQQLQLSDFQVGLVQGLSVALFAAVVGYPISWLADRYDRRLVLAGCIAVWSVSVALCGLSRNFTELFIASALVGAGEAGLLPIAYAYIPELFRGQQRVVANSMFIVAGRFGVGFVIAGCGYLVTNVAASRPWLPAALQDMESWRLAFLATALPGILIVLLILTTARRVGATPAAAPSARPPSASVMPFLRAQRLTFGSFYVGLGLAVFGYSAIGAFLPVVAMRQMGATPVQVGNAMGTATFAATAIGLLLSVGGMRWLNGRLGLRLPILMLTLSSLLGTITAALFLAAQSVNQLFMVLGLQLTFLMAGSMLFPTALQDMTPTALRARLIAIVIMVNIVLSSLAPAAVGFVSDQLKGRPDGLLLAAVGTGAAALLVSTVILAFCSLRYVGTVLAARASDAATDGAPH